MLQQQTPVAVHERRGSGTATLARVTNPGNARAKVPRHKSTAWTSESDSAASRAASSSAWAAIRASDVSISSGGHASAGDERDDRVVGESRSPLRGHVPREHIRGAAQRRGVVRSETVGHAGGEVRRDEEQGDRGRDGPGERLAAVIAASAPMPASSASGDSSRTRWCGHSGVIAASAAVSATSHASGIHHARPDAAARGLGPRPARRAVHAPSAAATVSGQEAARKRPHGEQVRDGRGPDRLRRDDVVADGVRDESRCGDRREKGQRRRGRAEGQRGDGDPRRSRRPAVSPVRTRPTAAMHATGRTATSAVNLVSAASPRAAPASTQKTVLPRHATRASGHRGGRQRLARRIHLDGVRAGRERGVARGGAGGQHARARTPGRSEDREQRTEPEQRGEERDRARRRERLSAEAVGRAHGRDQRGRLAQEHVGVEAGAPGRGRRRLRVDALVVVVARGERCGSDLPGLPQPERDGDARRERGPTARGGRSPSAASRAYSGAAAAPPCAAGEPGPRVQSTENSSARCGDGAAVECARGGGSCCFSSTPAGFSQPENLAPLLGKVTPAVALVVAQQRGGQPIDTGTAFVVDSDGILLTALHVVALADQISVRLPDHPPLGADVIAIDTVHDAAVLRVPSLARPGPTPLPLGDDAAVQPGAGVVVVGYPLASPDHPTVTVNQGIVSVVRTEQGYIQIDAAVNPGDSGGPVLTLDGKVIGIVDASVEGAQNFNLALPIDVGRALLQRAAAAAPLALPLTAPSPVPINFASPGIGPHSHRDALGAVCVPPPPHAALLSDVGVNVSVEGGLRVVLWLSWAKGAPLQSPASFGSVDATTMRQLSGTLPGWIRCRRRSVSTTPPRTTQGCRSA